MVWLKLLAVVLAAVLLVWHFPFLWEIGLAAIFGACFWLFARPPRPPASGEGSGERS
ncbi:hypothetical protein [Azospira sp. I13]|uniref:hypothetical protein n=1 Tax=Azospira sp. I13 TaxID=1765050 RepID=UPI001402BCB6|nr:hypothetical protein [Azospira sp. I13]